MSHTHARLSLSGTHEVLHQSEKTKLAFTASSGTSDLGLWLGAIRDESQCALAKVPPGGIGAVPRSVMHCIYGPSPAPQVTELLSVECDCHCSSSGAPASSDRSAAVCLDVS